MTSALKHKQRSQKSRGPIHFKSDDKSKHELIKITDEYGTRLVPIYKRNKIV